MSAPAHLITLWWCDACETLAHNQAVAHSSYGCQREARQVTYRAVSGDALDIIAAEREHQIKCGFTPEHDLAEHDVDDMLRAITAHLHMARSLAVDGCEAADARLLASYAWPWEPGNLKVYETTAEHLIVAGALTAALIDLINATGGQS